MALFVLGLVGLTIRKYDNKRPQVAGGKLRSSFFDRASQFIDAKDVVLEYEVENRYVARLLGLHDKP